MGDINPGNILFNVRTKKPVIVDIDSAQIGNFRSVAKTDDYFDPNVEIDIHDDESYYSYTTDSDIFGMTALSFEFVTGLNPFDVATQSELTLEQNITRGNSYIKYHNLIKRGNKVFEIENDEGCQYCCARLDHLLEHHPKLYHHFASVLVYKKREYFLAPNFWKVRSGKRTVRRKKWSDYRGNKHIPKARKNDPAELNHFMNTYNINLRELLS